MKRALTSLLCLFAALVMSAQETENLKKVNIDSLFNEALTSYDENRLEDAKDQLHQVVKVCVREKHDQTSTSNPGCCSPTWKRRKANSTMP